METLSCVGSFLLKSSFLFYFFNKLKQMWVVKLDTRVNISVRKWRFISVKEFKKISV